MTPPPKRPYQRAGLTLRKRAGGQSVGVVKALQADLRALGYLAKGLDGDFGPGTERAVKGLQHDLLNNHGAGSDGSAPVAVADYSRGRVSDVTGEVDQALAACIADLLADPAFVKLPRADDAPAANAEAVATIQGMRTPKVPVPFLLAILEQESNLRHYRVPTAKSDDSYVTVGLDRNGDAKHIITSRGYGVGQYTLFHHPPRPAELRDFIVGVGKNVSKAVDELLDKFTHFVNGPKSGTQADDRLAEAGRGKLRLCKYAEGDAKRFRDCQQCMREAGQHDIVTGTTPWYAGASKVYQTTQYHGTERYPAVPIRSNIPCDWPYAVRRYNGAGQSSYHYQTKVLKKILRGPRIP